jgi:LCP family protein required for cell wall assembly
MPQRDTRPSIDGFRSPRRRSINDRPAKVTLDKAAPTSYPDDVMATLVDLSLDDHVTTSKQKSKLKRKFFRRPSKRQVKWMTMIILLFLLIGGGIFAWKVVDSSRKIFKGNVFNAVSSLVSPDKALKTDANGNTNILLLGTSESDPNHPGAQLTDSMMIMSINKTAHTAFLLSIPRDLWVKGDGPCAAGYQYKINAVYECYLGRSLGGLSSTNTDEATAEALTATKVGGVVGVDISYVIHMNLAVIQQVVDAVGGIDITIDSPDPRGILDTNFDWRCDYKCNLVKYPNGPAHLTGVDAMWLAQARNDAGGYGLPRSNFDREANQRKIVIATKDKATSIGFLANPLNAIKLLDAMGNDIHTTIDSSEIKSFVDIAKTTPSNNITSIDIMDNGSGILTTGTGPDGSSIVEPVAGLTDYTAMQTFTSILLAGYAPVVADAAPIDIVNASSVSGAAQTEAASLGQKGYIIGTVSSAPSTYKDTNQYTIIDLSKGTKSGTLAMLKKDLGTTTVQTKLPDGITSTAMFVVILGDTSSANPKQ